MTVATGKTAIWEFISSQDDVFCALSWIAVVTGTFVLAHCYMGIMHDGVLYLGQSLAWLSPEMYAEDPYFKWGSQDRYTLFSPLYAWLIVHLGIGGANVSLVLAAQGLFLIASYVLVRVLVQPGLRGYAMIVIVFTNGLYGGYFFFRIAEQFVTPRPFVEAATLFALALLVSGHKGRAFLIIAGSALLHPLLAFSAALYAWLYCAREDRRWLWLACAAFLPLALAIADIAPFSDLFRRFDREWMEALLFSNRVLFLTQWRHFDWIFILVDILTLALAVTLTQGRLRAALQVAIITAVVSLLVTFVGADLLHNVLISNLQPWRALWIVHWMAKVALVFVIWRLWNAGSTSRLLAALALFCMVTRGLPVALVAAVAGVVLYGYRHTVQVSARAVRLSLGALMAGAIAVWMHAVFLGPGHLVIDTLSPRAYAVLDALSKPQPLLVIAAAIIILTRQLRPWAGALLSSVFLIAAATAWDQRSPARSYVEAITPGSHPFSRIVGPEEQVMWYGSATATWVMMQRASYYSEWQRSGQMYSRHSAIEIERRRKAVAPLILHQNQCIHASTITRKSDSCQPSIATMRDVCSSDRKLGYLVLESKIDGMFVASWTWPVEVSGPRPYYYLYDCKKFIAS